MGVDYCKKRICVDYDGTIVDEVHFPEIGKLKEGVKEFLSKLIYDGYYITIYSCRNNPSIGCQEDRFNAMVKFLKDNEVPYHDIELSPKPLAYRYIDDRAIAFTNWKDVYNDLG
jgi:hypothetical protein